MKKNLRKIGFVLAMGAMSVSITNCGGMSEEEIAQMEADMNASMSSAFDDAVEENSEEIASEETNEMEVYDLSGYGIPVSIVGPAGASVKSDLTEQGRKDFDAESYSVTKGKFAITVYMDNDPDGNTVKNAVEESRIDLDGTIVEELDNGFISVDEDGSHDFVYVIEKEGKILEFTIGLTFDDLTKEDIYTLINSIKA